MRALLVMLMCLPLMGARLFDDGAAPSQYLEYSSAAVITAYPFTFSCWGNSDDATVGQVFIATTRSATNVYLSIAMSGDTVGDPMVINIDDGPTFEQSISATGYSTSTWHHLGGVAATSTSRIAYIDGTGGTEDVTPDITPTTLTTTRIGRVGTDIGRISGSAAECAAWDVALTAAEMASLGKGFSPLLIRPQSLVSYWPLIGRISPELDLVGPALMTLSGSVSTSAHPRVFMAD